MLAVYGDLGGLFTFCVSYTEIDHFLFFDQSVQTTQIQSAESFAWQIGLGRASLEKEFESFKIKTNIAGSQIHLR